jgi:hypothetical protein
MTQALDPRHNLGPSLEHVRDELAHALPGSDRAVDAFGQVSELMHQVPRAFDDCSWLRSHGGEAAERMCDLHDQVALDFATVSDAIASIDRLESALQGFGGDLGDLADELLPAIDGVERPARGRGAVDYFPPGASLPPLALCSRFLLTAPAAPSASLASSGAT